MAVHDTVDEDDVDDAEPRPTRRAPANQPRPRRMAVLAAAAGLLAVVVVVLVVVVTTGGSGTKKAAPPSQTQPTSAPPGFRTFRDVQGGYSLSYPEAWLISPSDENNVAIQVTMGTNPLDTMLVRDFALPSTIDLTNVNDIKSVTDAVISGAKVGVLKQQPLTVNALPGYYYFYTLPRDPTTGTTLVHSHFFVFPPHQMVSLVFQTTSTDFAALAPVLDKVVASVTPLPGTTTPASTSTSAP